MGVTQGSTLYAGGVSKAAIYEIDQGLGLQWADYMKTEIVVDRKPRQLTRAEHAGNPITENISNPASTDFPAAATVTIDGRQLTVAEMAVFDTLTALDWKETFPEYQPSGLNIDLKANPKIMKVVLDRIMEATKTQINELHSNGDSALISPNPLRFYDGLWTSILADVDTTAVGAPTVLTSANILDRVYEIRNAVDARLRFKPNLRIFCSVEDFDLYDVARRKTQTQLAETDIENNSKLPQSFGARIDLIPVLGMAKNEMFATVADKTDRSNLVQGVWMENDVETLKVAKLNEFDQDWRIVMRFDMGVNYKSGKDIWYVVGV